MTTFDCEADGCRVIIEVSIYNQGLIFEMGCPNELSMIVAEQIQAELNKRVKGIRQSAYRAGKRAARGGPKIGDDDFNDCINDNVVGWSKDEKEGWVDVY